eukprot:CAMPEP_0197288208 /NCGR_PEP_ID=MMETSP0890-20130614/5202_1 /TAXON_ID=44058 ORGANISM="Aureoumbra lagunensis, Strain CCMP1510" /NCGR_SAMPLE_ID=MMETSP0890 /ASSEMBLY_ACC=CAM_ASM_000533 /LENGTH=198 /DNA_ID=CAMNT_0042758731 /DNA_START=130 /DNA_END=726 /DNA_ORIENTATION=-
MNDKESEEELEKELEVSDDSDDHTKVEQLSLDGEDGTDKSKRKRKPPSFWYNEKEEPHYTRRSLNETMDEKNSSSVPVAPRKRKSKNQNSSPTEKSKKPRKETKTSRSRVKSQATTKSGDNAPDATNSSSTTATPSFTSSTQTEDTSPTLLSTNTRARVIADLFQAKDIAQKRPDASPDVQKEIAHLINSVLGMGNKD